MVNILSDVNGNRVSSNTMLCMCQISNSNSTDKKSKSEFDRISEIRALHKRSLADNDNE